MNLNRPRNDATQAEVPVEASRDVLSDADKLLRIACLAREFNNDQIRDDALSVAERVVPVTAVPTIVRFGACRQARVRLRSGDWTDIAISDVEEYVSEARNQENRKGVAALEVFVPSPLLRAGMCFVDTPGLGSVFAGNTAATHAFLPHIDAAIVVIGADPPIAGDELTLVENVAKEVLDILFVLNKADRVTEHERDAATSFAKRVLGDRLHRPIGSILEISAQEQLNEGSSRRDWPRLVEGLEQLVQQSGRRLVREAADRSTRRLSGQLLAVVHEERDALTRPFEESEVRIKHLWEIVAQAEQSLNELGFLFSGEQQRLSKTFGDRRKNFLKSVRAGAHEELDSALTRLPRTRGPLYRQSAMQSAQDVARRHTMPWLESEEQNAEKAYDQVTRKFTARANEFLVTAHNLGGAEMTYLPKQLEPEQSFRTRSEFRFHESIELVRPASPVRYVADLILGAVFAHSVIASDAREFLNRLLETNSERVRNDLENRVTESRRRLEAEIRGMLRELSAVAERALAHARAVHADGAEAVKLSLRALAKAEAELVRFVANSDVGNP
jgi:hypothetical protein